MYLFHGQIYFVYLKCSLFNHKRSIYLCIFIEPSDIYRLRGGYIVTTPLNMSARFHRYKSIF